MRRRLAVFCSSLQHAIKAGRRHTSTHGVISREVQYCPHNFHPLPVAISRGLGAYVWDEEGRRYLDCLSGNSSVNHGHCHPRLVNTMIHQLQLLHQTSRNFHHDALGEFAQIACEMFGYDTILPLNTGAEAIDMVCRMARNWAYAIKGVQPGNAKILFPQGNFWGHSLAAISASGDLERQRNQGPFMPHFPSVKFNSQDSLFRALHDTDICAYVMEPIQNEAGVIIPDLGYLMTVREMCNRYNVLWVADETTTGLGRTGMLLGVDHEKVRPDILVLGKSLSGGMYPLSAILASTKVMSVLNTGEKGTTFSGNPLAMRVGTEALRVLEDESLVQNAETVGQYLYLRMHALVGRVITEVRGRGLMMAADINSDVIDPWEFALRLRDVGILTRPTEHRTLRFMPPLCVTMQQVDEAMENMGKVVSLI